MVSDRKLTWSPQPGIGGFRNLKNRRVVLASMAVDLGSSDDPFLSFSFFLHLRAQICVDLILSSILIRW